MQVPALEATFMMSAAAADAKSLGHPGTNEFRKPPIPLLSWHSPLGSLSLTGSSPE
jgi:hypothetical protein